MHLIRLISSMLEKFYDWYFRREHLITRQMVVGFIKFTG